MASLARREPSGPKMVWETWRPILLTLGLMPKSRGRSSPRWIHTTATNMPVSSASTGAALAPHRDRTPRRRAAPCKCSAAASAPPPTAPPCCRAAGGFACKFGHSAVSGRAPRRCLDQVMPQVLVRAPATPAPAPPRLVRLVHPGGKPRIVDQGLSRREALDRCDPGDDRHGRHNADPPDRRESLCLGPSAVQLGDLLDRPLELPLDGRRLSAACDG